MGNPQIETHIGQRWISDLSLIPDVEFTVSVIDLVEQRVQIIPREQTPFESRHLVRQNIEALVERIVGGKVQPRCIKPIFKRVPISFSEVLVLFYSLLKGTWNRLYLIRRLDFAGVKHKGLQLDGIGDNRIDEEAYVVWEVVRMQVIILTFLSPKSLLIILLVVVLSGIRLPEVQVSVI